MSERCWVGSSKLYRTALDKGGQVAHDDDCHLYDNGVLYQSQVFVCVCVCVDVFTCATASAYQKDYQSITPVLWAAAAATAARRCYLFSHDPLSERAHAKV